MAQAVSGLFTSAEQARWAIKDLKSAGFTDAQIVVGPPEVGAATSVDLNDASDGHTVVSVTTGEREAEAIEVMARHSAEMLRRSNGGEIGDISDAPREADGQPVMTEPAPAGVVYVHDIDPTQGNEGAQAVRGNIAQTSGQYYDMMRTSSDDGTVPPTARREAITAPPLGGAERIAPNTRATGVAGTAPMADGSDAGPRRATGGPRMPLEEFAARDTSATEATPDLRSAERAARMIDPGQGVDPATGETAPPYPTGTSRTLKEHGHADPGAESLHKGASGATQPQAAESPPPLSPTERQRLSGNEDGHAGGSDASSSIADPDDPQNRIAHEQPDAGRTDRS